MDDTALRPVAVLDINETALDLSPVREVVDEHLGAEGGFVVWFQRLLQLAMASNVTEGTVGFTTLAESAFDAVARTSSRTVPDGSWGDVVDAFGRLEAHPDVAPGLERLRALGWSTVALTNSDAEQARSQIGGAGLAGRFDLIVSVEEVGSFKPDAAPYRHVAQLLDRPLGSTWMVATHDWDLAGARAVGMRTAYVRRPGSTYADCYPPADVEVDDFVELARHLAGE
ncbi:HAD family hydrolase [Ilumatobacter sp.]|uniref:HAD family hydrolase n=1 Tax=Ilumatobacter sp. TaxID=1967498 RepID=UPI003B520038